MSAYFDVDDFFRVVKEMDAGCVEIISHTISHLERAERTNRHIRSPTKLNQQFSYGYEKALKKFLHYMQTGRFTQKTTGEERSLFLEVREACLEKDRKNIEGLNGMKGEA
jgi:hypothetical protein